MKIIEKHEHFHNHVIVTNVQFLLCPNKISSKKASDLFKYAYVILDKPKTLSDKYCLCSYMSEIDVQFKYQRSSRIKS